MDSAKAHRIRLACAALASASIGLFCAPALAQTTVTWTGAAGDGNYSNPGNWNPQVVPVNVGTTTYRVLVPTGSVTLDAGAPTNINVSEFVLGASATFRTRPGRGVVVLGVADVAGVVDTSVGGSFTAASPTSTLTGTPQLLAGGGGLVQVGGSQYSMTSVRYGNFPIFTADGTGSVLNLSSLLTLNAGWNDQDGSTYVTTVSASNNGRVDLSGVQTLTTPARSEDRIDFNATTGGVIDLSGLQTIQGGGRARFNLSTAAPVLSLPALTSAANLDVIAASGTTFSVPVLTTLYNASLSLADGSTLNAPLLNTVNFTRVAVQPGRTVNIAALTNIDNSQFDVSGGATAGSASSSVRIAATGYSMTGYRYGNFPIFTADGTGSVLNLSSLLTLNAGWNDQDGSTYVTTVSASNNGRVDLSGVQTLTTPARSEDRIDFNATTGGVIDLGALQSVSGGGSLRLTASGGGRITFSDLSIAPNVVVTVADSDSSIAVGKSLFLRGGSITLPAGSAISIGKHLYNQSVNEASADLSRAILRFETPGLHLLEVAGLDLGPISPGNSGNFGLGRVELGTATVGVSVQILDLFNNGNRGQNQNEALYIFGLGQATNEDSLVLRSGSVLYIDNLNVYARENGNWIWLNSLFGPGQTVVAYGQGYLHLPSPGGASLIAALGMATWRRRRA